MTTIRMISLWIAISTLGTSVGQDVSSRRDLTKQFDQVAVSFSQKCPDFWEWIIASTDGSAVKQEVRAVIKAVFQQHMRTNGLTTEELRTLKESMEAVEYSRFLAQWRETTRLANERLPVRYSEAIQAQTDGEERLQLQLEWLRVQLTVHGTRVFELPESLELVQAESELAKRFLTVNREQLEDLGSEVKRLVKEVLDEAPSVSEERGTAMKLALIDFLNEAK